MGEPNLTRLEREVETARVKLANNLSTLRSPATYSEFREDLQVEAIHTRDALMQQARAFTQSTAQAVITDLKAKAAANPGAALLIGAGLAWRLIRNPPVATALVGAGLVSLFRTAPALHTGVGEPDYLSQARTNLGGQIGAVASDAQLLLGKVASNLSQQVSDAAQDASDNFWEKRAALQGSVRHLAENATEILQSTAEQSSRQIEDLKSRSTATIGNLSSVAQDALDREEVRDKVFLGAAKCGRGGRVMRGL
jgi:ElaB/YqjD/DUF883 family membrane-anchored ribosome-binding protein